MHAIVDETVNAYFPILDQIDDFMDGLVPTEAHQARFAIQANAMLDALEGKPCHLATLEEARLNLMVALGAKRSWTDRTIVSLDQ